MLLDFTPAIISISFLYSQLNYMMFIAARDNMSSQIFSIVISILTAYSIAAIYTVLIPLRIIQPFIMSLREFQCACYGKHDFSEPVSKKIMGMRFCCSNNTKENAHTVLRCIDIVFSAMFLYQIGS